MKTVNLLPKWIAIGIFFLCQWSAAQTLHTTADLTPTFLKQTFDDALVEVLEVKDTYLKTKDVFDFYVDIDPTKRFVSFSGNFLLVEGASPAKVLELVNRFNTEIIMVKSYYNPAVNAVTVYYYFWTEGGFTKTSLLKSYKMMRLAINLMLEKDVNKLMK